MSINTPDNQSSKVTKDMVYEALMECFDPEIPINIVDLGLIYEVKVKGDWVGIKMTLTTPGCGMGGYIAHIVRTRLLEIPGVHEADVQIVWEPKWTPFMMSEEARSKLGLDNK